MNCFESIKKGLEEAIDYEEGKGKARRIKKSVKPLEHYSAEEVRQIRTNADLSQALFAQFMGVSKKTVEAWEAGRNTPNGTAQRMLDLVKRDPDFPHKSKIINE